MFDLLNVDVGTQYVRADEPSNVSVYTSGSISTAPIDIYILIDGGGEVEVDREYMDYLKSENAVEYAGTDRDTFNNFEHRYILL